MALDATQALVCRRGFLEERAGVRGLPQGRGRAGRILALPHGILGVQRPVLIGDRSHRHSEMALQCAEALGPQRFIGEGGVSASLKALTGFEEARDG